MAPNFALGMDRILRCTVFAQLDWQTHGFGTRHGNPSADVTLRQVHSDRVLHACGLTDRCCEGDALVSDVAGLSIGVRTADCVPILLIDVEHRAVAAVHAGWRGTAAGIVSRAFETMRARFATDVDSVHAAIGPAIQACCYEVGPEVVARLAPLFPEWPAEPGRRKVDLPEANRRHLLSAGIAADRIYDCGLCTYCQADLFFSYRRDPKDPGRMLSAIGLKASPV
jgi:purine-nucleoside/S-methyl-5'-thioadenosine phosphorylase / adenosine deaminase